MLLTYVRFKDDSEPKEEMLFARSLSQETQNVKQFLMKFLRISKKTILYSKIRV